MKNHRLPPLRTASSPRALHLTVPELRLRPASRGSIQFFGSNPSDDGDLFFGGAAPPSADAVRVMAGNLSNTAQSYEVGDPGSRIFQGAHPGVALIQEANTRGDWKTWVTQTF